MTTDGMRPQTLPFALTDYAPPAKVDDATTVQRLTSMVDGLATDVEILGNLLAGYLDYHFDPDFKAHQRLQRQFEAWQEYRIEREEASSGPL